MTLYTEMQSLAGELIAEFGAAAVLKRQAAGARDATTGTVSVTSASQPVRACVFDYDQKFIDGALIRTGDKQVYMSAVGIALPLAGDVLTWAGVDYTVLKCKPLAPSGSVMVVYELQARQ